MRGASLSHLEKRAIPSTALAFTPGAKPNFLAIAGQRAWNSNTQLVLRKRKLIAFLSESSVKANGSYCSVLAFLQCAPLKPSANILNCKHCLYLPENCFGKRVSSYLAFTNVAGIVSGRRLLLALVSSCVCDLDADMKRLTQHTKRVQFP